MPLYPRLRLLSITSTIVIMMFVAGSIGPALPERFFATENDESYSVILMIGDGMGPSHVELGRLVEYGQTANLSMQQAPLYLNVTTYSSNSATTDSAAAATAMATGEKTNNGMISILPNGTPVSTILEIAKSKGKATGVISTSIVQHATPAAFMTHVSDRNNYVEITRQIVEEADVDVLLGGGLTYFSTSQLESMEDQYYSIVNNRNELLNIESGKVLGLFANSHMPYEQDRDFSTTPSLAEMTNKSLQILSQDADGFFLMVEGSEIDFVAHDHDKSRVALEAIAFDQAVAVAMDYIQSHSNTILVVTADHETGGLAIVSNTLSDELPSSLTDEGEKRSLRVERSNNITVTWSTTSHTTANVPLFSFGPTFGDSLNGTIIDNTDIFDELHLYIPGEVSITTTTDDSTTSTLTTPTTTTNQTDSLFTLLTLSIVLVSGISLVIIVALYIVRFRKRPL